MPSYVYRSAPRSGLYLNGALGRELAIKQRFLVGLLVPATQKVRAAANRRSGPSTSNRSA